MTSLLLNVELKSATTFGRGDGLAGVVNVEVQHDAYGFPFLGGKTLKGLLSAACAEILYSLGKINPKLGEDWSTSGQRLFGNPGSKASEMGILHVSDATLPEDLRSEVSKQVENEDLTAEEVLQTLTDLRRQTAMDAVSGAPKGESLRTLRVILREMTFAARIDFMQNPTTRDLALLAACVRAMRRVGTGRNRGRGRVKAALLQEGVDVTTNYFKSFEEEVTR
jgi:hypothetical protein